MLAKTKSNLQVGLLLESIQLATEFEREMSRKFGVPVSSTRLFLVLRKIRSKLTQHVLESTVRDHCRPVSHQRQPQGPTRPHLSRV